MTDDVLTQRMAGPAIRAWQIAEALAPDHEVVLATTSPTCQRSSPAFGTEAAGPERFAELERWCTVVLFQGYVLNHVPVLRTTDKVMVVDLYDPLHLEALELNAPRPEPERSYNVASSVRVLGEQMLRGDFFVCASEKQRDLWLGFLSAAGRVNPANYAADPSLRSLIDVVAFGLPGHRPEHTRAALKGVVPGIGADDEVVLWGGGVYDWFDPLTAIRALDRVRESHPKVRLFFLGVRHPNPAIEEARTLVAARELARELGLYGTHVFFNEEWVDYDDRQNFLLESDVAISLHVEHIEAAYSFRTRILDYMWAGLPIVATRGDTFAELIEREGLGAVVPGEDVEAVAAALGGLLGHATARQECRDRTAGIARRFVWAEVLRPLVQFCAAPSRAADLDTLRPWPPVPGAGPTPAPTADPAPTPGPTASGPLARLEAAYRRGGAGELVRAGARFARRRVGGAG
ncbi:MAG: glycosyltransferase [Actinomycetota bacterium]|nr:glycosyltransferase [Actinomycetota bacterium]